MATVEQKRTGGMLPKKAQQEYFYSSWNKERRAWGFTPDQRDILASQGKVFYWLTGETLGSLIQTHKVDNRIFELDENHPAWNMPSLRAEVAFDPQGGILKRSTGTTFETQLKQVGQRDLQIRREVPGTRTIIGELADQLELAALLAQEQKSLFTGEFYSQDMISHFPYPYWIRTSTVVGSQDVGMLGGNGPFALSSWPYNRGEAFIVTHPLVVNAAAV